MPTKNKEIVYQHPDGPNAKVQIVSVNLQKRSKGDTDYGATTRLIQPNGCGQYRVRSDSGFYEKEKTALLTAAKKYKMEEIDPETYGTLTPEFIAKQNVHIGNIAAVEQALVAEKGKVAEALKDNESLTSALEAERKKSEELHAKLKESEKKGK